MIQRFRVATRATGIRRQVFVHIYEDRDELARRHTEHQMPGKAVRRRPDILHPNLMGE